MADSNLKRIDLLFAVSGAVDLQIGSIRRHSLAGKPHIWPHAIRLDEIPCVGPVSDPARSER